MSNFFLFGPRPLNVSPRPLSLFPAISASADFAFSLFYFILFFVITLIKLPGGTLVLYGLGLLVWSVFLRQWNIERVRELLRDQRLTIRCSWTNLIFRGKLFRNYWHRIWENTGFVHDLFFIIYPKNKNSNDWNVVGTSSTRRAQKRPFLKTIVTGE